MPREGIPTSVFIIAGLVIGLALIAWYQQAKADSAAELRKMDRDYAETLEDIRAGRYRAPAKVRIVP